MKITTDKEVKTVKIREPVYSKHNDLTDSKKREKYEEDDWIYNELNTISNDENQMSNEVYQMKKCVCVKCGGTFLINTEAVNNKCARCDQRRYRKNELDDRPQILKIIIIVILCLAIISSLIYLAYIFKNEIVYFFMHYVFRYVAWLAAAYCAVRAMFSARRSKSSSYTMRAIIFCILGWLLGKWTL